MTEKLLDRKTTDKIQIIKLTNYPDHKRSVMFHSKIALTYTPPHRGQGIKFLNIHTCFFINQRLVSDTFDFYSY